MKLVIIDRDGVVSQDPDGRAVRADDWRAVSGALAPAAALEALLERLGVAAGRRARRVTRSSLPTATRLPS